MSLTKKILFLFTLGVCALVSPNAAEFDWSSPPTMLSNPGVNATSPCVVNHTNGDATAVWLEEGVVLSSSYVHGGGWGSIQTVSGVGSSAPSLGIDANGNVTALWLEGDVVKSARLPVGGSWTAATALSSSSASQPVLAVDANGNTVAVWVRSTYIESAVLPVGGSWSIVSRISDPNSDNPSVAIGASQNVIAVWHRQNGGFDEINYSTLVINSSWTSASVLIADEYSHNYPVVAVDPNGNAAAVWFRYVANGDVYLNVALAASEFDSQAALWSIPTLLSGNCYQNPANLIARLVYDGSGNAVALWTTTALDNSMNLESAVKPVGKDWKIGGNLVAQNTYAYAADLGIVSSGEALCLYMYFNGTSLAIESSTTDAAGVGYNIWSSPLIVSTGTSNAYPRVANALDSGLIRAVGVWMQSDGVNNSILASTASRPVVDPPTDLQVVQNTTNFGSFSTYSNTISWLPSIDPDLAGYNIFRNGIFWNQVAPDLLSVTDYSATLNGAVTYGVAAINSSQEQSPVVIVNFP